MSDNEDEPLSIEPPMEALKVDVPTPAPAPIKVKKPRTEKQMIAFQNAQLKRQENILLRKTAVTKKTPTPTPRKEIKAVVSDSEEEEVIYIKSQKKPKKISRKTIVIEESSESESEPESFRYRQTSEPESFRYRQTSEEEPETKAPPPTPKSKFTSQQNRKSLQSVKPVNMFCD